MNEKKINSNFDLIETGFENLYIVKIFARSDNRGSFEKDYSEFVIDNIKLDLKEVFYTRSKKNVIRANHFQSIKPQSKFIRCLEGEILDVVVDMRKNSKTFMKYFKIKLTPESCMGLYIPSGFSHGYIVKKDAIVSYKCDEYFLPEGDFGFKWNDDKINIDWEISKDFKPILSEKDESLPSFLEIMNKLSF